MEAEKRREAERREKLKQRSSHLYESSRNAERREMSGRGVNKVRPLIQAFLETRARVAR